MRLLLAGVIWIVFVGGVALYTSKSAKQQVNKVLVPPVQETSRPSNCRVWTSFSASPDPFALGGDTESQVLRVTLNGKSILVRKGSLDGSSVQESQISTGLKFGQNELFIETSPPYAEHDRAHAARLQLESNGRVLVDRTFWSVGGTPIVTSITFEFKGGAE